MIKHTFRQLQEMVNEVNSYSGDLEDFYYYEMEQLDDLLGELEVSEVLRMVQPDFNIHNDYFQIDSLGHLISKTEWEIEVELLEYHDEIIESFIDNFGADRFIDEYGINSIVINQMTIDDFYELDNVVIDTDGFTFIDKDNDINITVRPNEEVTEESFKDHLQEEFIQNWEELKLKVYDAYKEYENDL